MYINEFASCLTAAVMWCTMSVDGVVLGNHRGSCETYGREPWSLYAESATLHHGHTPA